MQLCNKAFRYYNKIKLLNNAAKNLKMAFTSNLSNLSVKSQVIRKLSICGKIRKTKRSLGNLGPQASSLLIIPQIMADGEARRPINIVNMGTHRRAKADEYNFCQMYRSLGARLQVECLRSGSLQFQSCEALSGKGGF